MPGLSSVCQGSPILPKSSQDFTKHSQTPPQNGEDFLDLVRVFLELLMYGRPCKRGQRAQGTMPSRTPFLKLEVDHLIKRKGSIPNQPFQGKRKHYNTFLVSGSSDFKRRATDNLSNTSLIKAVALWLDPKTVPPRSSSADTTLTTITNKVLYPLFEFLSMVCS